MCDFCGYRAQVKTQSVKGVLPEECPHKFMGAAWGSQRERIEVGIYFSRYLAVEDAEGKIGVWFLPRDMQAPEMFIPRTPLAPTAKRAGWQGFMIDTSKASAPPVRYAFGDLVDF